MREMKREIISVIALWSTKWYFYFHSLKKILKRLCINVLIYNCANDKNKILRLISDHFMKRNVILKPITHIYRTLLHILLRQKGEASNDISFGAY